MIKIILGIVALAVGAVLALAAAKPDEFRVERSASIKAPPDKIFPHIDDLHLWAEWSPYEKLDPAMKRSFSGPAQGKGAAYAWEGNSKVGAGRMEIAEQSVPSKIVMKLDFLKPMECHNTAEFVLEGQGDATRVTWRMAGPAPFISKVMQVFVDMDRMVGKDFEVGLANLKAIVEK